MCNCGGDLYIFYHLLSPVLAFIAIRNMHVHLSSSFIEDVDLFLLYCFECKLIAGIGSILAPAIIRFVKNNYYQQTTSCFIFVFFEKNIE